MRNNRLQSGFTIIELMIATVVFSVVLLVILGSFIQVGRMYYKGVSLSNTQNAARSLTDSITNDLRFTSFVPNYSFNPSTDLQSFAGAKYFCIGEHRYTYTLGKKLTADDYQNPDSLNGVWVSTFKKGGTGICPQPKDPLTPVSEQSQLLSPNMQLNKFDYSCANDRCNISLHIIYYGADDTIFTSSAHPDPSQASLALTDPDATCTGSLFSSQFCGAIDLNTTVLTRE